MAGVAIMYTAALFALLSFFFQKKQLDFLQNSIVFMVIMTIVTTLTTFLSLNLGWIKITVDPYLFPAFLLYRNILLPLAALIVANSGKKLFVAFFALFAALSVLNLAVSHFDILVFVKTPIILPAALNAVYLLAGMWIARIVTGSYFIRPDTRINQGPH